MKIDLGISLTSLAVLQRGGGGTPTPTPAAMPSGVVARWSADDITPVADDTAVATWTDSVHGLAATGSGGAQPFYRTNQLNGKPGLQFKGAESLSGALTGTALKTAIDSQDYTILVLLQGIAASTNGVVFGTAITAVVADLLLVANATDVGRFDGSMDTFGAPYSSTDPVSFAYSSAAAHQLNGGTTGLQRLAINGGIVISAGSGSPVVGPQTTDGNYYIGVNPTYAAATLLKATIHEIIVFDHELTQPEHLQAQMSLCDKWGMDYPWAGQSHFQMFAGNSLTAGYLASKSKYGPCFQAATDLGLEYGQWGVVALHGQRIASMDTNAETDIDPISDTIGLPVKLYADEYYNQRWVASSNAATILGLLQTYVENRRAALGAPAKIVIGTAMDSTNDAGESDATRSVVNAGIISNAVSWGADAVFQIQSDTNLGVSGANASSTYFNADHVHLTGAAGWSGTPSGYPRRGSLIATALAAV